MIDPRFFLALGPLPASTLAAGLPVLGDGEYAVQTLAALYEAAAGALCYAEGKTPSWPAQLGCVIASPDLAQEAAARAQAVIVADAPRAAFARIAPRLVRPRALQDEGAPALIEPGATIAPSAFIGAGAEIGSGAEIEPHAVIGPGVAIGRGARIGAGASIRCALIGDRVSIGPQSVIGEAGFGVAGDANGLVDMPHFGRVIIQDRVRIGAHVAIDRGMLADTTIGEDCKIDNHCHIAHNVSLGRGVIMAAFAGLSGSVTIGDGVRMGGRVGIVDHVRVGQGASLAACAAVLQDVPAGQTWGGFPAKPLRTWLRETAWLKRAAGQKNGGD